MAKIYKMSGYLVGANDDELNDSTVKIETALTDDLDLFAHHLHIESVDIGEWDYDSPLNYDNCDLADCEKYFQKES